MILVCEVGQIEPVMKQRPECTIGKAVIIIVEIILTQIQRGIANIARICDFRRHGRAVGGLTTPAEPQTAIFTQGIVQGDSKPAGLRFLVGCNSNAIGDNNQSLTHRASFQLRLNRVAQVIMPTIE